MRSPLDDPHLWLATARPLPPKAAEAAVSSDHKGFATVMNHFVYKLIPPRPTFHSDMSDAEKTIMGRHVQYWQDLLAKRTAVVFGPVLDPTGTWGLAIVEAETDAEVRHLGDNDPAVTSGMATYGVIAMPRAIIRL